jgi:hypothetical protein
MFTCTVLDCRPHEVSPASLVRQPGLLVILLMFLREQLDLNAPLDCIAITLWRRVAGRKTDRDKELTR